MKSSPSVATQPEEKKSKYGKFDEYDIANAADTLQRAEEIKGDTEKMTHVKTHMAEKHKAMTKVAQEIGSLDELKAKIKKRTKKDDSE